MVAEGTPSSKLQGRQSFITAQARMVIYDGKENREKIPSFYPGLFAASSLNVPLLRARPQDPVQIETKT